MFRRPRGKSPSLGTAPSSETRAAGDADGASQKDAAIPREGDAVHLPGVQAEGTVGALLGQGGQGVVYALDVHGESMALKWYFPRSATNTQRRNVEALVERGAPHPRFLWPTSLAVSPDDVKLDGFGYAMPLRPDTYVGLSQLIKGRIDVSFRVLATMGMQLADGYLALHSQGLCYRDISFANVFFEPSTGDILICDTDNVGIDGVSTSAVRGTPYFMAPEIVRNEAMPSLNTDLWSLSVLLFYIFFVHHPLEGRRALEYACWDEEAIRDLFGAHPVFLFDPDDASNAPEPGMQDNPLIYWDVYPEFFRALFVQAFTDGVRDPVNGRVREGVWRSATARLYDTIVFCQKCGRQSVSDDSRSSVACWSCATSIALPPRLRVGRQLVMLNHDTVLRPRHFGRGFDRTDAMAEVVRHPTDPSVWGLRNLSDNEWTIDTTDDASSVVRPGRAATLTSGLRIDFGAAQGTVTF